jgi:hypothetical protein
LRADVAVWDVPTHAQIPYWAGADLLRVVVAAGRIVAGGATGARQQAPCGTLRRGEHAGS